MGAVATSVGGDRPTAHTLRTLVGSEVAVHTDTEHLEGTLLSCTERSLWIVAGDVDHLVAVPRVVTVARR